MRSWSLVLGCGALVLASGCAGGNSASGGPTTSTTTVTSTPTGSKPSAGDAARVICEAECRRHDRCKKPEPDCLTRCGTLPIREPPVWHTDWARQIGVCIESADCDHDSEEKCTSASDRKTHSSATCAASATSEKSIRVCQVLNGLTDGADAEVDACLKGGTPFKKCAPPFDWK